MYIEHIEGKLKRCSLENQELLKKYNPYLYKKYLQVDEIARRLPNATADNLNYLSDKIFDELVYLDEKKVN